MLFFFFLIIDLYFLNPTVIAQIFNPIAQLATRNSYRFDNQRSKSRNLNTSSNCKI